MSEVSATEPVTRSKKSTTGWPPLAGQVAAGTTPNGKRLGLDHQELSEEGVGLLLSPTIVRSPLLGVPVFTATLPPRHLSLCMPT